MTTTNEALRWRPTNAPEASSRTDDIWFLDPQTGWAVNSNGQILKTEDGGASWQEQFHSGAYLRCVGFANASKGWVGTLDDTERLYSTEDGGQTWSVVANLPTLAPSAICGLSVVNESVIYASGTNYPNRPARMMKSLDGGATWEAWEMGQHATLLVDTFFTSPEEGWVVGGKAEVPNPQRRHVKPVVLHTADGGRTWTNRVADLQDEFPFGEWGWKIQFLDDRVGFVSLENFTDGAVLKTTDGGETWARLPVNDQQGNANLEGVGFTDERRGWVGGWGTPDFTGGFSSATEDGGANWRDANEIGRFINRFRFFGNPATVGYASGRTVYKYSSEPVPPPPPGVAQPVRILDSNEPQEGEDSVEIVYTVPPDAKRLSVVIRDRFGEVVRRLLAASDPPAGRQSVEWAFTNDYGESLPPGFYIYRIDVNDESESRIVLKSQKAARR
jgi:photosystem II stability/assembly factor-like uncharacterized protein